MSSSSDPKRTDAQAPAEGDEAIPMLTEVVQIPRYAAPELPGTLDEVDWAALEKRVQDNVIERLMRRSGALFDEQLQPTVHAVIERALGQLSAELRTALAQLTRELVAGAVADEITRVHAEMARRDHDRDQGADAPR